MQEVIIISIIAWWIAEGSNLVQMFKNANKLDRLKPFDCPKCLGFWMGVLWCIHTCNYYEPILISTGAMLMSKLYYGRRSL